MNEGWIEEYEALPKADSHRLIDFEQAEVVTLKSFPPPVHAGREGDQAVPEHAGKACAIGVH